MNKIFLFIVISILMISCTDDQTSYVSIPFDKIALGKSIFFDTNLSNPIGQACASCHAPEKAFSDPNNSSVTVGANGSSFGSRNTPSLSYNIFSPKKYYNTIDETFIGGLFIDGRSESLQEQFIHPLLNPLEMNNSSASEVALKIRKASYFGTLTTVYGQPDSDETLLGYVADALSRFQKSSEVNSFSSKFDYVSKGLMQYTEDEKNGLLIFKEKGKCAQCHIIEGDENTGKVLFTDFSYDNIGVPKNASNPFYSQPITVNPIGMNFVDLGIGKIENQPQHNGKFRVPTLRNVAITAPYFHNGSFKTLKEVIHFYNVRDLKTGEFEAPETNQNVNTEELGDLKLTPKEEFQLEKFLETLTDHYRK